MPHHRRLLATGAAYHVTARTNRSEPIFDPRPASELFLLVLKQAHKRFVFELPNFTIMPNHIHLLIKPSDDESLSKIMQWILSVFAMRWNRAHDLHGHVWGERFFSRIINSEADWLHVFAYIDENPVRANLVGQPWQWKNGGIWQHRTGRSDIVNGLDEIMLGVFPGHRRL
ncbi:MAG: transposase [Treponema sp.]|jgi:putative transposase|nr:transposase [Treponema sp.]